MQDSGKYGRNVYNGLGFFVLIAFPFLCVTIQATNSPTCVFNSNENHHDCPHSKELNIFVEFGSHEVVNCDRQWSQAGPWRRGAHVSDLSITLDEKIVGPEGLIIVNENLIQLPVQKLQPGTHMYKCRLKLYYGHPFQQYEDLMHGAVVVGFKPKKPHSFNCVSNNWEKLFCKWKPVPNPVPTRFSLRLEPLNPRASESSIACPRSLTKDSISPNKCTWDGSTDPPYRRMDENFIAVLNAENALGRDSFTYSLNHWALVIPSRPVNLSVSDETYSSALLHWTVPYRMQNFPPGLHYRVSYRSQSDGPETWKTIDVTNETRAARIYFNLTNLEHANTSYTVRVYMKSSIAVDENLWSEFSSVTFRTASSPMSVQSRTDVGSYEIIENGETRNVYIYWRTIPGLPKYEDNLPYKVVLVKGDGSRSYLQPDEMTKTYVKFSRIGLENVTFQFISTSETEVGSPIATVHVPNQKQTPQKPDVLSKIAFDGSIYELSWNSSTNPDRTDYTIFWCESAESQPDQCLINLDWVHVPRNTNTYNVTVPDPKKTYRFAIATNTPQVSSGMTWFSDSTTSSNTVGKVKSVRINRIGSDFIEIGDLEYSGRIGTVEGINIYYCPLLSPGNCVGSMLKQTVRGILHQKSYIVRDLRPNTTYMYTVAMLTENNEGPHSNSLYFKTSEAPWNSYATSITPANGTPISGEQCDTSVTDFVEALNRKLNEIDELKSKIADSLTHISSLTRTISAFKDNLESLSKENCQLRANLTRCCPVAFTIGPDITIH